MSDILDLIWKQCDNMRHQEESNKPSLIEAETGFLQNQLKLTFRRTFIEKEIVSRNSSESYQLSKVQSYLNDVMNNHNCSNECKFSSMKAFIPSNGSERVMW